MSIEALNWALSQEVGSPTDKFVLIMLANWADPETFDCYPSTKKIMKYTEYSRRTVRDATERLIRTGFIRELHRTRRSAGLSNPTDAWANSRYQLLYDGPATAYPDRVDWIGERVVPVDPARPAKKLVRKRSDIVDNPSQDDPDDADDQGGPVDNSEGSAPRAPLGVHHVPTTSGTTCTPVPAPRAPLDTALNTALETSSIPAEEEDAARDEELIRTYLTRQAREVIVELLEEVPVRRRPGRAKYAALVELATTCLSAGWLAHRLVATVEAEGPLVHPSIRSVYAVLSSRLAEAGDPPPLTAPESAARRPDWCGEPSCDPQTRRRVNVALDGPLDKGPCPTCHPTGALA